ncbi:MAG: vitamin K epoxide reductase family protein [Solirubrobacterales bacterium]|nr:vitamin K epoxide reductase family protein [Solirubrobacterales bacterium]
MSVSQSAAPAVGRERSGEGRFGRRWIPQGALHRVMMVLVLLGLAVAAYLTYVHYAGVKPACTAGQSCLKVQTSEWSKLAGVPVALIGLIGYITILASLLLPDRDETRLVTLGLTLIGFGFSAYLTYRELFSIHAVCEWCASSAVIMTLLLGCSVARYLRGAPTALELDPALLDEEEPSLAPD